MPETARCEAFVIQVMDHEFGAKNQKSFVIFVVGDPDPVICNTSLRPIKQFVGNLNIAFKGKGGKKDYTWSKAEGEFPEGLILKDNILGGIPTSCGTYDFLIRLKDRDGKSTVRRFRQVIYCKGDMNNDFIVDLTDVILLLQGMTGIQSNYDATLGDVIYAIQCISN